MDEIEQTQDTGVDEVQAAAGQSQEVEGTVGSPDAGQQSEQPEIRDEKDFAKALSAREAQIRANIQKEYEDKYKTFQDPLLKQTMEYYGYTDVEAYKRDLAAAQEELRVQQQAQQLGVPEDVIRQHLMPLSQETQQLKTELQTLREQEQARNFEAHVNDLKSKYPDFEANQDAIFEFAVQNRLEVENAYKLLTYDQKLESAASEAQRQAIQNIQKNAHSPGPLGGDAPSAAGSYVDMTPAERKAFRDKVKYGG